MTLLVDLPDESLDVFDAAWRLIYSEGLDRGQWGETVPHEIAVLIRGGAAVSDFQDALDRVYRSNMRLSWFTVRSLVVQRVADRFVKSLAFVDRESE